MQPNEAKVEGDRFDRLVSRLARLLGISTEALTADGPETATAKAPSPEGRSRLVERRKALIQARGAAETTLAQQAAASGARVEAARRALAEASEEPRRVLAAAESDAAQLARDAVLSAAGPDQELRRVEYDLRATADPAIRDFIRVLDAERDAMRVGGVEVFSRRNELSGSVITWSNRRQVDARLAAIGDAIAAAEALTLEVATSDEVLARLRDLQAALPSLR